MANSIDIVVPDLGDFSDVEIIEVLVSEGDRVAREDGLVTLETDKASMDVPSPDDGTIESLKRFTEDVREVREGFECGVGLTAFNDFEESDILEFYVRERVR